MPTYEYRCPKCQKNFEVFQKISDPPLKECPQCGEKPERLVSAASFALKGPGWYKDGYSVPSSKAVKSEAKKNKKD